MKKTLKSTLDKKRNEKKSIYLGDYYCMKEMQPRPVTEEFLRVLTEKLLEWVQLPDSLALFEFQQLMGLRDKDYALWRSRYENLQEAHEYAKRVIGTRREVMATRKQLDAGMIKHTLYQYAPEYREAAEYNAKLARREMEGAVNGLQFVVVPKIESENDEYFKKDTHETKK